MPFVFVSSCAHNANSKIFGEFGLSERYVGQNGVVYLTFENQSEFNLCLSGVDFRYENGLIEGADLAVNYDDSNGKENSQDITDWRGGVSILALSPDEKITIRNDFSDFIKPTEEVVVISLKIYALPCNVITEVRNGFPLSRDIKFFEESGLSSKEVIAELSNFYKFDVDKGKIISFSFEITPD
jgi:hypothetical protein